MVLVGVAWWPFNPYSSLDIASIAILGAPVFCALSLFFVPGLFIQALIVGTPSVSIIYAFSMVKRNWRGVVGGALIASALLSAADAISHI
jgi:hypothetical protein